MGRFFCPEQFCNWLISNACYELEGGHAIIRILLGVNGCLTPETVVQMLVLTS